MMTEQTSPNSLTRRFIGILGLTCIGRRSRFLCIRMRDVVKDVGTPNLTLNFVSAHVAG
jgi:hypothetical protein